MKSRDKFLMGNHTTELQGVACHMGSQSVVVAVSMSMSLSRSVVFRLCDGRTDVCSLWHSLKCSVSGGSASSSDDLADPCEKPILHDDVEVAPIFALSDSRGGAAFSPNTDEDICLKVRL